MAELETMADDPRMPSSSYTGNKAGFDQRHASANLKMKQLHLPCPTGWNNRIALRNYCLTKKNNQKPHLFLETNYHLV